MHREMYTRNTSPLPLLTFRIDKRTNFFEDMAGSLFNTQHLPMRSGQQGE
jgi:hypothetical protein